MAETPCTNCDRPGSGKFCEFCGSNQSHRSPENELIERHTAAYVTWLAASKNRPTGEDPKKAAKVKSNLAGAKRRFLALHKLCTDAGRPFALPADMQEAVAEIEQPQAE